MVGTFIASVFWRDLGFGKNFVPLGLSIVIAFAVSLAGIIIGFGERKEPMTWKTWIGLIGNFIIGGLFVILTVYAMKRFTELN